MSSDYPIYHIFSIDSGLKNINLLKKGLVKMSSKSLDIKKSKKKQDF